MNTITTRIRRMTRAALLSLSLLTLALSVCMAEGWGYLRPPTAFPSIVTTSHVVYTDGCELTVDGNYTRDGVTYSVPAATQTIFGDLHYSDGTTLHSDGTWSFVSE